MRLVNKKKIKKMKIPKSEFCIWFYKLFSTLFFFILIILSNLIWDFYRNEIMKWDMIMTRYYKKK